MDDLKQRLTALVKSLPTEDAAKNQLVQEIEQQELTDGLLGRVQEVLDASIAAYQKQTTEKMNELESRLEQDERNLTSEFKALQAELKKHKSEQSKQQDQQQLDEIRKQLSANS